MNQPGSAEDRLDERRVTLLSVRSQQRQPGFGLFYEFEDVVSQLEDAPIVATGYRYDSNRERVRRLAQGALAAVRNPPKPQLVPSPDSTGGLVLLTATNLYQLRALDHIPGDDPSALHCAYLPELWPQQLARASVERWRPRRLDHVFVSVAATAAPLAKVLDCPVTYVPLAVDVARFAKAAEPGRRPIDILNVGRRDPAVHDALRQAVEQQGWRYHFDTARLGDIPDFAAHRDVYASLVGLSTAAICNNAKFDEPDLIDGRRETSSRLFECLAAGTAMVGQPPDAELLEQAGIDRTCMILWEVGAHDAAGVRSAISELLVEELAERRRASIDHAATAHDWSHRWKVMTDTLGLPPARGMAERAAALACTASRATSGVSSARQRLSPWERPMPEAQG